jgi:hypothetical protein
MKTKTFIYGLLIFLSSTLDLLSNQDSLQSFFSEEINKVCPAVEPSFDLGRGVWLDGCGREILNPYGELISQDDSE